MLLEQGQIKWSDEPYGIKNGLVTKLGIIPVSGEMKMTFVEPHKFERSQRWRWDRKICKHCNRERGKHDAENWVEARYS